MWKKIGSIGPSSNNNKSSRSRDQNPYQPFSQISKIRVSDPQFIHQSTQLFCPNFLNKKKTFYPKYSSQSKILKTQESEQLNSFRAIPDDMKGSLVRRKTLNRNQMDQIKQRISQKIIDSIDDSLESGQKTNLQQNFIQTDSTQIIVSQTSLEQGIKQLKHVKSSPQFNFSQIGDISDEISLNRKSQAQNNIKALRREHTQIKKTINKEVHDFKTFFHSAERQIEGQIAQAFENKKKLQINDLQRSELSKRPQNEKLLNFSQIGKETKTFTDKFKDLSAKKNEMIRKLASLRQK